MRYRLPAFAIAMVCLLTPSLLEGQPVDRGPHLGGVVSRSFGDGGPATSVAVSAGYRFTPRLGVELEVSHLQSLDFGDFPACPPEVLCILAAPFGLSVRGGVLSLSGRATSFTVNLISELPIGARWIRPYGAAGGGLANVRRELFDDFIARTTSTTSTEPVMTIGGGADFPVWRGLAVGVDLRYQRVFEEEMRFDYWSYRSDFPHHLNLTRLGTSVRYRF
jgi:opacity protein-like surface antigen